MILRTAIVVGMRTVLALALCTLGPALSLAVAQEHPQRPAGGMLDRIKANDTDGDGRITKEEAGEQLKRFFDRIDTDGDGAIDEAELKKLGERLRGRGRPGARPQPRQPARRPAVQVPEGVELTVDVPYRDGNEKWRLDLAVPKSPGDEPRPAVVFIHGGGWRSGDKGGGQWRAMPLEYAADGYVCISVNYRLTDEAPFPACVEDVKCAVRWLRANAQKYHVDPERIGAYGNSAGAHLVAMLGTSHKAEKLEGDGGNKGVSSRVHAVVALATPADMTTFKRFAGNAVEKKLISPVSYVDKDSAKFLLIHSERDRVVPHKQSVLLKEKLTKYGVPTQLITIKGGGHAFWNGNSPTAQKTLADSITFFQETLEPAKTKTDKKSK